MPTKNRPTPLCLIALALLSACKHRPELYCSETEPCTAGYPICDLQGICNSSGFVANTCIPAACWDAGANTQDASDSPDSGLLESDSGPEYDACVPNECSATDCGTVSDGCDGTTTCLAGCSIAFVRNFTPSDAPQSASFGKSVAIDGDRVLVGAPDRGPNNQGAVYAYEYDGVQWIETIITAETPVVAGNFGSSVALDGNLAAVGSAGRAFVLTRGTGGWSEDVLTPSDDPTDAFFGSSVAIDGNRVVVGAPGVNAIYVFDFNGAGWNETILRPPTSNPADGFGTHVAVEGAIVAVAAPFSASDRGAVHVFELSAGSWRHTELVPMDTTGLQNYGSSLSISGTRVFAGASGYSMQRGAAYFFERIALNTWSDTMLVFSDAMPYDQFGLGVASEGDWLIATSWRVDGRMHSYTRANGAWVERNTTLPDSSPYQVDVSGRYVVAGAPGAVAHLYEQVVP